MSAQFSQEMVKITNEIKSFFIKYEGGSHGMEFSKEIGTILARLKHRILREEEVLFPNYERLMLA